jgi:plasmid replication initiation protein
VTYDKIKKGRSIDSIVFHIEKKHEMTDTSLMAGLQAHVYPLYDELKALRGLNGVKDHL